MADTDVWVKVEEGNYLTSTATGRSYVPGSTFAVSPALADEYRARGWVAVVDPPEPEPEPDRSDWVPVRVVSELHLDGKSYSEGDVLDLSPVEFERYHSLGCITSDV